MNISPKQFGAKIGKHAQDYGLDPSKAEDRAKMVDIINDIIDNHDEVRYGVFRGQGEELPDGNQKTGKVEFYIKGNDVVIANDGEFVSILKDGVNNPKVNRAKKR